MNPTEYAAAVVDVLADEFPDLLADPAVARILENKIVRHATTPEPQFDWIMDMGTLSWRLKADQIEAGKVRITYHEMPPSNADVIREKVINDKLQALEFQPS